MNGKKGQLTSLSSKVVGMLLCVFLLYVVATWLTLTFIQFPTFEKLENQSALDQLNRVHEHLHLMRNDVDLLGRDWAQWDDTKEFVLNRNEEFYVENLSDSYLADLGMSFGIILNIAGSQVWGEAYLVDDDAGSIDRLFPNGFNEDSPLRRPVNSDDTISGIVRTQQGPAIISSSAILSSEGEGPASGHFIVGKMLGQTEMEGISQRMLTRVDILPLEPVNDSPNLNLALAQLTNDERSQVIVKNGTYVHALTMLRDLDGNGFGALRVTSETHITALGSDTMWTTISALIIAALVLTLTLWIALRGMMILPIEQLTAIFRGGSVRDSGKDHSGDYLLSTVNRLAKSKEMMSQRNDEIGELVSAFNDLSRSLQDASTAIWQNAHLDGLTGIANRRLFVDRLQKVIAEKESEVALFFIDLDGFKSVNDQLGHDVGDRLLIEVSTRIQRSVGIDNSIEWLDLQQDKRLVARFGGDEFVAMIRASDERSFRESMQGIAATVVESLGRTFTIGDEVCTISACVGLAIFPHNGSDVDQLITHADRAMYAAKRAGKNTWRSDPDDLSDLGFKKSA